MSKWYKVEYTSLDYPDYPVKTIDINVNDYNGRVKVRNRIRYEYTDPLTVSAICYWCIKFKDEMDLVGFKLRWLS